MRNGFIFNHNKCVDCNACSAACILENGWTVHPRKIFTYNSEAEYLIPLINLSMACNHCESAVCMESCPVDAYTRDEATGAVLIDEKKCIGCRYCVWNCPYDAPKFENETRTIEKCDLCNSALKEGRLPACSSACPTGALGFGPVDQTKSKNVYSWFPQKDLNPAINFTNGISISNVKIIPEYIFGSPGFYPQKREVSEELQWSLIVFSFLITLAVSSIISSLINGVFPDKVLFIPLLVFAGLVSFFHLGRIERAWRSVTNLRHSPLSREIAAYIVFSMVASAAILLRSPSLLIASSVTGLILLLLIDGVYLFADRSRLVFLHSGQTFISSLLIISFFSGTVIPFIFIGLIKLGFSVYSISIKKIRSRIFGIRFLRIVFMISAAISLATNRSHDGLPVILIFLAGEFLDRILFYIDYNPLNINTLIERQLNIDRDEKKRG